MKQASDEGRIDLSIVEAIGTLTLNRPTKLNSLTLRMAEELERAADQIDSSGDVRAVIVRGAGRAFCAGADIAEVASVPDTSGGFAYLGRMQRAIRRIRDLRPPTIAVLHGAVMGGGLELALACDLRVACASSKLGVPEIQIGALPGAGGLEGLARSVGVPLAKWMVFTGQPVSGEEAVRVGLAHCLTSSDEEANAQAFELAKELRAQPELALTVAKQILNSVEPWQGVYDALGSALTFGDSSRHALIARHLDR